MKDRVVLIVGASSGIGLSTAELFARDGAKVMASARRQERLLKLQTKLNGEGFAIDIIAADATKPDEMERLAAETEKQLGRIEILFSRR